MSHSSGSPGSSSPARRIKVSDGHVYHTLTAPHEKVDFELDPNTAYDGGYSWVLSIGGIELGEAVNQPQADSAPGEDGAPALDGAQPPLGGAPPKHLLTASGAPNSNKAKSFLAQSEALTGGNWSPQVVSATVVKPGTYYVSGKLVQPFNPNSDVADTINFTVIAADFFDTEKPKTNISLKGHAGVPYNLALDGNPTTGYKWMVDKADEVEELTFAGIGAIIPTSPGLAGGPSKMMFQLLAEEKGSYVLKVKSMRPWEIEKDKQGDKELTITFDVDQDQQDN